MRLLGQALGIVALIIFCLLPPVEPLTVLGMRAIGVFLFTVIWWICVGIGYPSILCIVLLIIFGVVSPEESFALSLGHWIVIFLIGCFGLSEGLNVTGFSRRFALWFLTRRFVAGRPKLLLAMFLLSCTIMGCIMSQTVTVVIFITIAESMLQALGYKKGDSFAAAIMMGIAWAATVSYTITPFAHAGNVMMIDWLQRDFSYTISFLHWMVVGIPMGLLAYIIMMCFFWFVVRPDFSKFNSMSNEYLDNELPKLGSLKREEKITIGVFLGVVVCWVLPGLISNVLPEVDFFLKRIGLATPAIVGSCLLCIISVKKKPVLSYGQWMKSIEWSSLMLVAAVMLLGNIIAKPETGIVKFLTEYLGPLIIDMPTQIFVFFLLLLAVLQTNLISNLVSQALVYNIAMPVADSSSLNLVAIGVTLSAASNYAFALPSATIATALVIGSGWVSVKYLFRYGVILIIPMVLLLTFIFYPFASYVFQ
jgi:solute carrier family 13 (sodium-dependent dicarboxylate transporter), member 2/3/5